MPPRPWTATTLYRSPVGAFDPKGCDAAGLGSFVDGNTLQREHFFLSHVASQLSSSTTLHGYF